MAKDSAKQAAKERRGQKMAARKAKWAQIWQAFTMQRKQDARLVPYMLLAIIATTIVGVGVGVLVHSPIGFGLVGFLLGITFAIMIFTKRLERSVYARAEGQPGAAGWALDNLKSNVGLIWKTKTGVAANSSMDIVHRVVGLPGIILVGEGEPRRVKALLEAQRKRLGRLSPGTPIYEITVGNDEGQVPIRKLQKELVRLPRNLKKEQVRTLAAKLESIDQVRGGGAMQGVPKGPLPKNAMSGMGRRMRRTNARKKG